MSNLLAVGIDVAEQRKGLDLVALDQRRSVVASAGRLSVEDVVNLVLREVRPSVVCIDSPSGWSKSGSSRAAERELRRLGITAFATGADPGEHPFYRWIRVGLSIYASLSKSYPLFTGQSLTSSAAEVFPEASAALLAGRLRDGDETKQSFRRQVLRDNGVTLTKLPTLDRVDAALGALTGLIALERGFTVVGDPSEGVMLLPVTVPPPAPLTRRRRSGPAGASRRIAAAPMPSACCLCGCGAAVRRRFLPGHDAKLKARLVREHREGDEGATARLEAYGWL